MNVKHLVSYQFLPHPTWTCTQDNSLTVMLNHHCQQEPLRFTYKQHSSSTHINQLVNIFCQTAMNTISDRKEYAISDQKEYHLRPEGTPSQTRRNSVSDQKEYHLRPEGTPSQTRRNTFPDQNEYHLRPEGPPSQTRRNTVSDQKEYLPRPERIPSQTRRNTFPDQKDHHHRPEGTPSHTIRNTITETVAPYRCVHPPSVMSSIHLSRSEPTGGPQMPRSRISSVSVWLHSSSRKRSLCCSF